MSMKRTKLMSLTLCLALILPETGGIGTTIFRVGGAALIIIAGALLVAKKRTNNI